MRRFSQKDSLIDQEFTAVDNKLTAVERQVPVGIIFIWSGIQPPPGYLWCDGAEYGVEEYPLLLMLLKIDGHIH